MSSKRIRSSGMVTGLLLVVIGCGDDPKDLRTGPAVSRPPQGPVVHARVGPDGKPVAFAKAMSDDGKPTHYEDGFPAYLPDGKPIDYRPSNLMSRIARLPAVYVRVGTQEQVIFEGESREPKIDPETGVECWMALTCTNPRCPGKGINGAPFLYSIGGGVKTKASPGNRDTGNPKEPLAPASQIEMSSRRICPACKKHTGKRYVLPEVPSQKRKLEAELKEVRQEIRRNG